jgi:hypothetical protein
MSLPWPQVADALLDGPRALIEDEPQRSEEGSYRDEGSFRSGNHFPPAAEGRQLSQSSAKSCLLPFGDPVGVATVGTLPDTFTSTLTAGSDHTSHQLSIGNDSQHGGESLFLQNLMSSNGLEPWAHPPDLSSHPWSAPGREQQPEESPAPTSFFLRAKRALSLAGASADPPHSLTPDSPEAGDPSHSLLTPGLSRPPSGRRRSIDMGSYQQWAEAGGGGGGRGAGAWPAMGRMSLDVGSTRTPSSPGVYTQQGGGGKGRSGASPLASPSMAEWHDK